MSALAAIGMMLALAVAALPYPGPSAPPPFVSRERPVSAREVGASWRRGCPVGPADLRRVTVSHWGFDGAPHQGELIVHRDVALAVAAVFRRLYEHHVEIRGMQPVDAYGGNDDRSMAADNTSAFNCRRRTGSTTAWSEHSSGRAIDVNPLENPYVRGRTVLPPAGSAFTDRSPRRQGMVQGGDETVAAFAAIGWRWGGTWTSPTDFQHFSATGR